MSVPVLSIITGTLDRPEPYRRMAASVAAHTGVPWELIVADASTAAGDGYVVPPAIRIVERPRVGHVAGYNRAFRLARGTWVCWLNDDAEVLPGWAERAIEFMRRNRGIGLGAMAYDQEPCRACVQNYMGMDYANFGIIRRELGEAVGWFDECCWMYGGDNSLTYRVLLSGHGVAPIRPALIRHHPFQDQHRPGNETRQARDAETLGHRYHERLPLMREVYAKRLAEIRA